jgi:hypothetical protein
MGATCSTHGLEIKQTGMTLPGATTQKTAIFIVTAVETSSHIL